MTHNIGPRGVGVRRWAAGVINPRNDLYKAVEGRGGHQSSIFLDDNGLQVPLHPGQVLVVGLPGEREQEEATGDAVFDAIEESRPALIAWENVRGLGSHRNERVLQYMIDRLAVAGYCTAYASLDGSRFSRRNLPRSKRLWLVAADQQIDLPDPPKLPRQRVTEHVPGSNPTLWAILAANGF